MYLYEHDRTKDIVARLKVLGNLVRLMVVGFWIVLFGVGLALVTTVIESDAWWLGGIVGMILGFMFGSTIAAATSLLIEWMSQLLVAQGEILEALRERS